MKMRLLSPVILILPLLMGMGEDEQDIEKSNSWSKPPAAGTVAHKIYLKGIEAVKKEKYQEAAELFQDVVKMEPKNANAHNYLGYSLRGIAKAYTIKSNKAYQQALKLSKNHEGALAYQGELFLMQGELTQANKNLKRLEKLKSKESKQLRNSIDKIVKQARSL